MQLILRIGLKQFLANFSTLLVEAVAGYKDFSILSKFYPEELLEDLNSDEMMNTCKRRSTTGLGWSQPDYGHHVYQQEMEDEELFQERACDDEDNDNTDSGLTTNQASLNDNSDEMDDTIVDRISLDGNHVLLQDEDDFELHSCASRREGEGESDSLASETSEDRELSEFNNRRIRRMEDEAEEGFSGSADQHSIHSISMLMPKDGQDVMSLNYDQETESNRGSITERILYSGNGNIDADKERDEKILQGNFSFPNKQSQPMAVSGSHPSLRGKLLRNNQSSPTDCRSTVIKSGNNYVDRKNEEMAEGSRQHLSLLENAGDDECDSSSSNFQR